MSMGNRAVWAMLWGHWDSAADPGGAVPAHRRRMRLSNNLAWLNNNREEIAGSEP
jgi:hypothetical protein